MKFENNARVAACLYPAYGNQFPDRERHYQQIFARDAEQRIYFCEGILIIFMKCSRYF
jgi:hypothetical protein